MLRKATSGFNHTANRVAVVVLLSIVSGCASTPKPHNLNAVTPLQNAAKWLAPLPHQGSTAQLAHWWQQFNDTTLTSLLNAAHTNSPSLALAVAKIDESRASIVATHASLLPTLNATAKSTTTRTDPAGSAASNTSTTQLAKLDTAWEIDLFGRVRHSNAAANARLHALSNDWHSAKVSLSAEVAKQYVAYRGCQQLLGTYQQDVKTYSETHRLTEKGVKVGYLAPMNANLSLAALAAGQSLARNQQAQCELQIKALVKLTGLAETDIRSQLITATTATTATASTATIPTPAYFEVNSLPADLIQQRPDIAALSQNLLASYSDIKTQAANQYPKLTLTGDISLTGADLLSGGLSKILAFAPSLSVPLFSAGANQAKVNAATARYQQSYAAFDAGIRQAIYEVETALVNLNSSADQASTSQTAADNYAQYLSKQTLNWRVGGTSLLALQDTQRQNSAAQRSLISNQLNHVNAWIDLYKALGGGWREQSAVAQPQSEQSQ